MLQFSPEANIIAYHDSIMKYVCFLSSDHVLIFKCCYLNAAMVCFKILYKASAVRRNSCK